MSRQRMGSADAAWLHMDRRTNLMVINCGLWFDEPLDHARLRDMLLERLVGRFPRFRQRVVEPPLGIGVPSWEDDPNFDIDRHLHRRGLPAPGGRRELEEFVSDLMTTPLDRSKPLWDMYVVDGYGDGCALIARLHHCIGDGIALGMVLYSLTDEAPDIPVRRRDNGRGLLGTLAAPAQIANAGLHEVIEVLTHPRAELSAIASGGSADARALAKILLTLPDPKTVLKGKVGVTRQVRWTDPLPIDEIKTTAKATDTTLNDVVVTALTGALHRYLEGRDSLVDEIRAALPYNLRPLDEPLHEDLGNRFGLVNLDLPVGIADRRQRLKEVHRRMAKIKKTPEGAMSYGVLEAIGLTPWAVEQRLLDIFTSKFTAVVTNVPGPPEPFYFAGNKVTGVLPWVPTAGGGGFGVSIFSYGGNLIVGLQVDPGLVPDPETILADFERELKALRPLKRQRARTAA